MLELWPLKVQMSGDRIMISIRKFIKSSSLGFFSYELVLIKIFACGRTFIVFMLFPNGGLELPNLVTFTFFVLII